MLSEEEVKKDAISWIEDELTAVIGNPAFDQEQLYLRLQKAGEDGVNLAARLLEKTEPSFEYLKSEFPNDKSYLDLSNKVVFAATILINHQIGYLAGLTLASDLSPEQEETTRIYVLAALKLLYLMDDYYKDEKTEQFVNETRSKIFGIIGRS